MGIIDVGFGAQNFAGYQVAGCTSIDTYNSANGTGILDVFEMWYETTGGGVKAGTFYGSSTSYTARDYESIGTVTAGSKQTFTGKNCSVETGDFVGSYNATGRLELHTSGGVVMYDRVGDGFSGTNTYGANNNFLVALYATGYTAPTVTTQSASSVTSSSMTGNGTITSNGGGTITEKGICYKVGLSGDPTTSDSTAHDHTDSTGAYTESLTQLKVGTGYRLRAYAINSAGTGYGTTVQEHTLAQNILGIIS